MSLISVFKNFSPVNAASSCHGAFVWKLGGFASTVGKGISGNALFKESLFFRRSALSPADNGDGRLHCGTGFTTQSGVRGDWQWLSGLFSIRRNADPPTHAAKTEKCHGMSRVRAPQTTRCVLVCHGYDLCRLPDGQDMPCRVNPTCPDHQANGTDHNHDTPGHIEWSEGRWPVTSQDTSVFAVRARAGWLAVQCIQAKISKTLDKRSTLIFAANAQNTNWAHPKANILPRICKVEMQQPSLLYYLSKPQSGGILGVCSASLYVRTIRFPTFCRSLPTVRSVSQYPAWS